MNADPQHRPEPDAALGRAIAAHGEPARAVRGTPWRRWRWPILLFLLTCLSTFWVGAVNWQPLRAVTHGSLTAGLELRRLVLENSGQGWTYMLWVVGILLLHEMGHYIATWVYRVPASPPFFLPFPFNPIGTLGAVIAMQGVAANRRQIFDIGLAGPIAGLLLAFPAALIGVANLDLSPVATGELGLHCPLVMKWLIAWWQVPGYEGGAIWLSQLNPWFAAAWVGMLITGLNMMPVGQLDGGHVTFGLFGAVAANRIAQIVVVLAVAGMVFWQTYTLMVMMLLLLFVGTGHPPTDDDTVPMGPIRWALGLVSLVIPVLCFPPLVFEFRV